jgi:hypothetical protein
LTVAKAIKRAFDGRVQPFPKLDLLDKTFGTDEITKNGKRYFGALFRALLFRCLSGGSTRRLWIYADLLFDLVHPKARSKKLWFHFFQELTRF